MTSTNTVMLSGELSLRGIEELRGQIAEALATNDSVDIDATAVESVDTSVIQLLLSAQKTANAEGKPMSLATTATSALAQSLQALGLLDAAGAPLVSETSTWTIKAAA